MTIKVQKVQRTITELDIRPVSTPTELVEYVKTQKEIFDRDFLRRWDSEKAAYIDSLVKDGNVLHIIWGDREAIGVFALFDSVELGKDTQKYQYLSSFGFKSDYRYMGFGKAVLSHLIASNPRLCLHSTSEIKAKYYSKAGFHKISYISADNKWDYDDYVLSLVPDILENTGLSAKELSEWLYDYAEFNKDLLRYNRVKFCEILES